MIDGGDSLKLIIKGVGEINITEFKMSERVSFLDYIMGGTEIGVQIAIDFTLSNGKPSDPSSLHYLNPHTKTNQYTEAILAVLSILENYDSDQMFPLYGFGGKVPDCKQVSHCFALNGNIYAPECNGMKGVMSAYY